jgi:hypothetical protein
VTCFHCWRRSISSWSVLFSRGPQTHPRPPADRDRSDQVSLVSLPRLPAVVIDLSRRLRRDNSAPGLETREVVRRRRED